MEKNIKINVNLIQVMGEVKEKSEFEYIGTLNEKDGKVYIRYVDNGEKNLIKVDKNEISVKKGLNKLMFNTNKEYITAYDTPMGKMELRIVTNELSVFENRIYIDYDLCNGQELMAKNKFELKYKEM
ncbi:MAG: DUF1934 domain-containing protein [Clostridia bacterium]|nr:DUF1934 domain-containing protein [Clostridia bacterium]